MGEGLGGRRCSSMRIVWAPLTLDSLCCRTAGYAPSPDALQAVRGYVERMRAELGTGRAALSRARQYAVAALLDTQYEAYCLQELEPMTAALSSFCKAALDALNPLRSISCAGMCLG